MGCCCGCCVCILNPDCWKVLLNRLLFGANKLFDELLNKELFLAFKSNMGCTGLAKALRVLNVDCCWGCPNTLAVDVCPNIVLGF